jgi:hypothetical protein
MFMNPNFFTAIDPDEIGSSDVELEITNNRGPLLTTYDDVINTTQVTWSK